MAKVYTHTQIRLEFMKLELIGLVTGTVKSDTLENIMEECISDETLGGFTIMIVDNYNEVYGLIDVKIDWDEHRSIVKTSGDLDDFELPIKGEVSATIFKKVINLFNDYRKHKGLEYTWTVSWRRDIDRKRLNEKFGLKRVRPGEFRYREMETVSVNHPVLRELNVKASLSDY